ncbi:hypothetical protein D3C73_1645270 [compost metagenome]
MLTEYCKVDGCNVASNVTGSCAGPTSSMAVIAKYRTDVARLSTCSTTLTCVSRGSCRAIACSSDRQMNSRS